LLELALEALELPPPLHRLLVLAAQPLELALAALQEAPLLLGQALLLALPAQEPPHLFLPPLQLLAPILGPVLGRALERLTEALELRAARPLGAQALGEAPHLRLRALGVAVPERLRERVGERRALEVAPELRERVAQH